MLLCTSLTRPEPDARTAVRKRPKAASLHVSYPTRARRSDSNRDSREKTILDCLENMLDDLKTATLAAERFYSGKPKTRQDRSQAALKVRSDCRAVAGL
eukprot:365083-Chlamydomonas_euryale.AAC.31